MDTASIKGAPRLIAALAVVTMTLTVIALLASALASAAIEVKAFGYKATEPGGSQLLQSGRHPGSAVATFEFTHDDEGVINEPPRDIAVDLPVGSIGNPTVVPTCSQEKLATFECPADSQIGIANTNLSGEQWAFPIYNLDAPVGVLAQFGFLALNTPVHMTASIHSEPEYGITITVRQTPQTIALFRVENVFWGVPASPVHDEERFPCLLPNGFRTGAKCPSAVSKVLPFLTNPSACRDSFIATARVDSWLEPGVFDQLSAGNTGEAGEPLGLGGCNAPEFNPSVQVQPTTETTDSPSGLKVRLHVPQDEDVEGTAEAQLKDATLRFPPGLTVNPSSAAGLDPCSPDEVGLVTPVGDADARFDDSPVGCPDSSKLGTVRVRTPVLANPLLGAMYLATQNQNPFDSLLGLYAVVEDPQTGAIIKLAGKAVPDPQTGQLTVSFPGAPQLPFEDFEVDLFGGSRAAMRTPMTCGRFTTSGELVPWTAPQGETRSPTDSFGISAGVNGSECPNDEAAAPNKPRFTAGTTNPAAGAFSPFVLKLSREDGSQPIKGLEATLPKGLLGRLAGIPYCPDAALAMAAAGSGKSEQASPSCPAASQVGTVSVAAGAGSEPLYVPGKAYLAGPYKGAPLSLAVVTPAVAGPFDLGTVVVRNALQVDPVTTQIHVVSDPIPTILQGIPLDIRQITVNVDRPSFTLNPTNCEPAQVTGSVLSAFDQSASLSNPFQTGGCNALAFKPTLKLAFKGQTKRTGNPAVRAVLTAPEGQANIARTTVVLPRSEFIDQAHVNNPCTRVQFAENACPANSILGRAVAWSPLLDQPLQGYVYFRSNGGERKLPDIVADLNGQIHVILVGFIDSVKVGKEGSRVRTRFAEIPDAPVSRFELQLKGGKRGLIENSRNLCRAKPEATVQMNGHNGKIHDFKTKISTQCGKKKSKRKGAKK